MNTLVQHTRFEPSIRQKRARAIIGHNFFGVEEAIKYFGTTKSKYFGITPSEEQIIALADIPFSDTILEQYKNTHILIAVFPVSINNFPEARFLDAVLCNFGGDDGGPSALPWYYYSEFANNCEFTRWHLVSKTLVSGSKFKSWNEQQALLDKNEEVPSICVLVYTIIGYYLNTGEWLFENDTVRCKELSSDFERVDISVKSGRIYIWQHRFGLHFNWVGRYEGGIVSSRKQEVLVMN